MVDAQLRLKLTRSGTAIGKKDSTQFWIKATWFVLNVSLGVCLLFLSYVYQANGCSTDSFSAQRCPAVYIVRGIKQCCFNSTPDPFNGQTVNFIVKPPKLIESRTYVKKANLENYWNNTVLLLWQHTQLQIIFKNRVKHIVINVKIDNDALLIFKHCFKTLIPSCFKI